MAGQAEPRRHLERAPVPRALVDASHHQHLGEAGRARPRHDLVAVGVELRHVDVAMGVDESHRSTPTSPQAPFWAHIT